MKPDWKDAPEWAQWLAQDADGDWWWFENEPESRHTIWMSQQGMTDLAYSPTPWEDTLQGRPS